MELALEEAGKPVVNIVVIGVGGGGNNALNHMVESNIRDDHYIAVNTDKTYPKVETVNDIAWVMRECNGSSEIRNEIHEFLEGTEYRDICIFPSTIKRNGQEIPAVRFVIYPKRSQYNFGPAFLNHNK